MNLNINEQYGPVSDISMPSQIVDSFQQNMSMNHSDQEHQNHVSHSKNNRNRLQENNKHRGSTQSFDIRSSYLINQNASHYDRKSYMRGIKEYESKYEQHYGSQDQFDDINLSGSELQDTFLANLPILMNEKPNKQNLKNIANKPENPIAPKQKNYPQISLTKTKIVKNILPSQQVIEYIQIINTTSCTDAKSSQNPNAIILTICAPQQIQIISTEGFSKPSSEYQSTMYQEFGNRGKNFSNLSFNINAKGSQKQFYLSAWQKIQVGFKISKKDNQLGDIFQTITLQARLQSRQNPQPQLQIAPIRKKYHIQVQIHYIVPKLKLSYQGCSNVATISLNKVSMNKIAKNKLGEYQMMIGIGGAVGVDEIDRVQCVLQCRGNVRLFPTDIVFYKGQFKKITFKTIGNQSSQDVNDVKHRGAVIIKAKNAKVNFVFGVQLI